MNFYDSLNAHLSWKQRLREYLEGHSSEHLEPGKVGCDDGCELGKWIHAQEPALSHLSEFVRVRELHADFHRCAANVVAAAKRDDLEAAEAALKGEYVRLSALVVKAIVRLNKVLGEKEVSAEVA